MIHIMMLLRIEVNSTTGFATMIELLFGYLSSSSYDINKIKKNKNKININVRTKMW